MGIIFEYLRFIVAKHRTIHYSWFLLEKQKKDIKILKKTWKNNFKDYDINPEELGKYFDYQIFRFRGVKFIPTLKTLLNSNSILKYIGVRSYLDKLLYKEHLKNVAKYNLKKTENDDIINKDELRLIEMDKKRILKKTRSYTELFLYCVGNNFNYRKKSLICKKCKKKKECQKRKKNLE